MLLKLQQLVNQCNTKWELKRYRYKLQDRSTEGKQKGRTNDEYQKITHFNIQ